MYSATCRDSLAKLLPVVGRGETEAAVVTHMSLAGCLGGGTCARFTVATCCDKDWTEHMALEKLAELTANGADWDMVIDGARYCVCEDGAATLAPTSTPTPTPTLTPSATREEGTAPEEAPAAAAAVAAVEEEEGGAQGAERGPEEDVARGDGSEERVGAGADAPAPCTGSVEDICVSCVAQWSIVTSLNSRARRQGAPPVRIALSDVDASGSVRMSYEADVHAVTREHLRALADLVNLCLGEGTLVTCTSAGEGAGAGADAQAALDAQAFTSGKVNLTRIAAPLLVEIRVPLCRLRRRIGEILSIRKEPAAAAAAHAPAPAPVPVPSPSAGDMPPPSPRPRSRAPLQLPPPRLLVEAEPAAFAPAAAGPAAGGGGSSSVPCAPKKTGRKRARRDASPSGASARGGGAGASDAGSEASDGETAHPHKRRRLDYAEAEAEAGADADANVRGDGAALC
jgi:hypothetical protein